MPKMNAEQRAAVKKVRAAGGDDDQVTDALADHATPEEEPIEATIEPDEDEPGQEVEKAKPARRTARAKVEVIDDLFTPLGDVKDFLNLLYWGREGSGKTSDALTLANLGRVLVVNAEGGLKVRALRNRGINIDNISIYPKPGEPVTYTGLESAMLRVQSDLMDDPSSWAGVVWDSGTEVSTAFTVDVSDDRITKFEARTDKTVDVYEQFNTDRNDYGVSGRMVRKLMRLGRDLQCHFIVTALERRDVDEQTSKVVYGPAVPPGLQSDMLGYMDLVLHTKEADDERPFYRALAKRAGTARAKDRFDALPKVLVEPTVERILAYINEDITEADDPIQEQLLKVVEKPKAETAAQKRARLKAEKEASDAPASGEGAKSTD